MIAIDFDFHTKSKDEPFMESSDSTGRLIVYQSALDSFEELTKGTGQNRSFQYLIGRLELKIGHLDPTLTFEKPFYILHQIIA